MAGYMTKLQGYVYEGELKNGAAAAIENGKIVTNDVANGAVVQKYLGSADTTTKLLCKEVTTIYDNIPAYRFVVKHVNPANLLYFVENGFDNGNNLEWDNTEYATPVGEYLRAHPLQIGDEFVTDKVTGTIAAGSYYGVKTDGTVG